MLERLVTASPTTVALVALQALVVAFLALHDWAPLGRLNDVRAVQAADSRGRLVVVTLASTLPFAFGLWATVAYGLERVEISMNRRIPKSAAI